MLYLVLLVCMIIRILLIPIFLLLRKKNSMKISISSRNFFYGIFFLRGAWPPCTPDRGLRPQASHSFTLRTLVGTGSCSTAFKNCLLVFFYSVTELSRISELSIKRLVMMYNRVSTKLNFWKVRLSKAL